MNASAAGSRVNISYDVTDPDGGTLDISVKVSLDGGASFVKPAMALSAEGETAGYPTVTFAAGETSLTGREIAWEADADLDPDFAGEVMVRVIAEDGEEPPTAPDGFSLIPAGAFQMGQPEGRNNEVPPHMVYVSAFYMEQFEVSKGLWDTVYSWALQNGYEFTNPGAGVAENHPVTTVDWYDSIKWCNARSEMEGLPPVYYVDQNRTAEAVYRTGSLNLSASEVDWDSHGYRLPTEVQWEKAARGGLEGKVFPWGDEATGSDLNFAGSGDPFDGAEVPTTPVGYYDGNQVPAGEDRANAYGLYDVAGNVWEWCWDWYSNFYYAEPSASYPDTVGPEQSSMSLTDRTTRGGAWVFEAKDSRCAVRLCPRPSKTNTTYGLRCARHVARNSFASSSGIPFGSTAPFEITGITRTAGGSAVELHWRSTADATYHVEFSATLLPDSWVQVNDQPITATDQNTSYTDTVASRTGAVGGHYRVRKL